MESLISGAAEPSRPEERFDVSGLVRSFGFSPSGSARGVCKKMGLSVGLKNVDPSAYGGTPQPCPGCDLDALDFSRVLQAAGIDTRLLLDQEASRSSVVAEMRRAASSLRSGDLFVMSVAGHGSRGSVSPEASGTLHEGWCLWDGMLLDDEIVSVIHLFATGVRIVMVNDQCHSGGIFDNASRGVFRSLSRRAASSPMLIQFAACRADEASIGYPIGGTWTTALLKVLAVDRDISWQTWFDTASKHPSLTTAQSPQWFEFGPVDSAFRNGLIFT